MQTNYWKLTHPGRKPVVNAQPCCIRKKSVGVIEDFLHRKTSLRLLTLKKLERKKRHKQQRFSAQMSESSQSFFPKRRSQSVDLQQRKDTSGSDVRESLSDSLSRLGPIGGGGRFFTLSDNQTLYDLMARSIRKDAEDVQKLIAPNASFAPGILREKIKAHIDVRLAHVREDHKRLETAFIPPRTLSSNVSSAFEAIRANDTSTVRKMVLADPSLVFVVDATQQSLLHWACKRKMESLGMFLVEKGADVNKRDLGGRVPRELAKKEGLERLYAYIQKARPTYRSKFHHTLFVKKAAGKITEKGKAMLRA